MATWLVKVRQALLRSSYEKWIVHPQKNKNQLCYSQDPHNCSRAWYSIVGAVESQFLKAERTWVDHVVMLRAWVASALVDGKPKNSALDPGCLQQLFPLSSAEILVLHPDPTAF